MDGNSISTKIFVTTRNSRVAVCFVGCVFTFLYERKMEFYELARNCMIWFVLLVYLDYVILVPAQVYPGRTTPPIKIFRLRKSNLVSNDIQFPDFSGKRKIFQPTPLTEIQEILGGGRTSWKHPTSVFNLNQILSQLDSSSRCITFVNNFQRISI